jgi:hypothetical protein
MYSATAVVEYPRCSESEVMARMRAVAPGIDVDWASNRSSTRRGCGRTGRENMSDRE